MKTLQLHTGFQAIEVSLEGISTKRPPRFHLEREGDAIRFSARAGAPGFLGPDPASLGQFHEGLWEADVAELFLAHPDGERYLEINLSPAGAWWACGFRGPRNRDPSLDLPEAKTAAAIDDAQRLWTASIDLPLDYLESVWQFGPESRANVCFILGPPERRRHFSAAAMPKGPPDYHRPEVFLPVVC